MGAYKQMGEQDSKSDREILKIPSPLRQLYLLAKSCSALAKAQSVRAQASVSLGPWEGQLPKKREILL